MYAHIMYYTQYYRPCTCASLFESVYSNDLCAHREKKFISQQNIIDIIIYNCDFLFVSQ